MLITYLGVASFRLKTSTATIVCDPYSFSTGLHFPKVTADIVTISSDKEDHNNKEGIKNPDCFFIEGPGEYEIKEVMVRGFKPKNEQEGSGVVYLFEAEDLTVCHLGVLNAELTEKELKELENVDVLFVPIGGVGTINSEQAVKLVKTIDPGIVIPMYYRQPGMKEFYQTLGTLEDFLQEFELEPKRTDKVTVSSTTLPDEMELYVLERKV